MEEIEKLNICGIYKITSPTGRVYIGQSKNIKLRWRDYRRRLCKNQPILNKSFLKYGVENHTFEVIERCLEVDLNCRERYWQKYYDVLSNNGLNCIYVDEHGQYSKRENLNKTKETFINPKTIDIIDLSNGVFLYTLGEASFHTGYNKNTLKNMLSGKVRNKTSLIKSRDYEKGMLPNTLYTPKERVYGVRKGYEIIDFVSGEVLGGLKEVSEIKNIKLATLDNYLNGRTNNPTDLIYKKDMDIGKTPYNLCKNVNQKVKCINPITKEIFNSMGEAARHFNLTRCELEPYLNGMRKHNKYPIVRLDKYEENKEYNFNN